MAVVTGILETALYVEDLGRSVQFYQSLFGLGQLASDERFCALNVVGQQVLLLFRKGACGAPAILPGGTIPPHDAGGQIHLAFSIPAAELSVWERQLLEHHIPIEGRVRWPRGGESVYFRDPDGHLVELATPGVWAIY
jgi:catechol 2,3-dioxygenase-like lactoylglutathione lyase family enzyme